MLSVSVIVGMAIAARCLFQNVIVSESEKNAIASVSDSGNGSSRDMLMSECYSQSL